MVRFLGGPPEPPVLTDVVEARFFEAASAVSVCVAASFGTGGVVEASTIALVVAPAAGLEFVGIESGSFLMMVLRALRADGEDEKDDEAQSDALDGAEEYGDVI